LTADASNVDVVPLTAALAPAHAEFAKQEFGSNSYQGRQGYLRWLYEEAPHSAGLSDAKVAVANGKVVGCFHTMKLPWTVSARTEIVASPHNLMVAPAYRTGIGFALIAETFRHKHVLQMGAGVSVQAIYEKMGSRPIPTHRGRAILNPLTAPVVALFHRAAPSVLDRATKFACTLVNGLRTPGGWLRVDSAPTDTMLSEVADRLVGGAEGRTHVAWTPELMRWRFFSPIGPRHLLVSHHARGEADAIAIVSLGFHRSLSVVRIVEWWAPEDRDARSLATGLRVLLNALGANMWLGLTSDSKTADQWRSAGFRPVPAPPKEYELHRPRDLSFGPISFCGGAGDVGFEALPLDVK
jgi:hypothetical protein